MKASNPFSSCYLKPGAGSYLFITPEWGEYADETSEQREVLIEWFFSLENKRASIIGPHGTGKSTLLHDLMSDSRIANQPHERVQLSTESRNCRELWNKQKSFRDGILAVDGYEQLNVFSKIRLVSVARYRNQRLLVTAHQDQYGFTTIVRTDRSELLEKHVVRRFMHEHPELAEELLSSAMWRESRLKHGTNLRESLFDAYDWFEQKQSQSDKALRAR